MASNLTLRMRGACFSKILINPHDTLWGQIPEDCILKTWICFFIDTHDSQGTRCGQPEQWCAARHKQHSPLPTCLWDYLQPGWIMDQPWTCQQKEHTVRCQHLAPELMTIQAAAPCCAHIYVDCYSPQGSHDVEWIVESCLLWIVFQCEYGGVHEHPPSYDAQEDNSIAGRRLIQVQHLSRIEELYGKARKKDEWLFL